MLRKFSAICCVALISLATVGCDQPADTTDTTTDPVVDTTTDPVITDGDLDNDGDLDTTDPIE